MMHLEPSARQPRPTNSQPNSPLAANKHAANKASFIQERPNSARVPPRTMAAAGAAERRRWPALTVLPGFSLILDLLSSIF